MVVEPPYVEAKQTQSPTFSLFPNWSVMPAPQLLYRQQHLLWFGASASGTLMQLPQMSTPSETCSSLWPQPVTNTLSPFSSVMNPRLRAFKARVNPTVPRLKQFPAHPQRQTWSPPWQIFVMDSSVQPALFSVSSRLNIFIVVSPQFQFTCLLYQNLAGKLTRTYQTASMQLLTVSLRNASRSRLLSNENTVSDDLLLVRVTVFMSMTCSVYCEQMWRHWPDLDLRCLARPFSVQPCHMSPSTLHDAPAATFASEGPTQTLVLSGSTAFATCFSVRGFAVSLY